MMASTSIVTPTVEIDHATDVEAMLAHLGAAGESATRRRCSVTATIGTFTKKIEPYQKCSSSAPPTIGPKATAMPDVAPQIPSAFCRSDGSGKTLVRMARLAGKMKAAATPMSARVVISAPVECDERGGGREQAEEDQPDLHGALAAEAVPDAAAGEQQAGEGQAVGVDDPLQRRDGRPQRAG